jgi:hypothetical protein
MEPTESGLTFPHLDDGLTLCSVADRALGAFHSLVLDHLLATDGTAVWVDARNTATTQHLARVAPSRQLLDRIRVARAFTPFQHHALVDDLAAAVAPDDSLVVAPLVDWFYREDELRDGEDEAMLAGALDDLAALSDRADLPVLLSRHAASGVGSVVDRYVDRRLDCTLTAFGPRFSGDELETLLFDCPDGTVQTTLAFWRRVLRERHRAAATDGPEVALGGSH